MGVRKEEVVRDWVDAEPLHSSVHEMMPPLKQYKRKLCSNGESQYCGIFTAIYQILVDLRIETGTLLAGCVAFGSLILTAGSIAESPSADANWISAVTGDVRVIQEIAPRLIKLDLDSDGQEDLVAVVAHPAGESPEVLLDAFSYGKEQRSANARCLLVALHPVEKQKAPDRKKVLCGQSPILALRDDEPPPQIGRLVKRIQRAQTSRRLPKYIRNEARGDALLLQTEAGESVLYLSRSGFKWEELPGTE